MTTDRIEKEIEIKAPVSRVWKALTDYKEFGTWFRVNLEGPFVPGETARGNITYPGYEHLVMQVVVKKIEPERYFSFTWHPFAVDPEYNYSDEEPTLVEFTLTETETGTHVRVVESGFDKIPAHRRAEAFRGNEGGWAEQVRNIRDHVEKASQPAA
ncbi:MAG: SRPBCC family protein [Methyloceanibacter sp.]|uniref:SRPBCC family protein n=1 Tax=Methyloceanibacter sp. TaxID=1965321 RepID=UPI003D6CD01A